MSTAGSSYVAGPAPRCNTEQGDPSQDLGSTSSLVLHTGLLDKQTPLPTPAPTRWGLRRGSSIVYSFSTSIHVQAVLQVRSHVHRHAWLQNFLLARFPTWERKKKGSFKLIFPFCLKKNCICCLIKICLLFAQISPVDLRFNTLGKLVTSLTSKYTYLTQIQIICFILHWIHTS